MTVGLLPFAAPDVAEGVMVATDFGTAQASVDLDQHDAQGPEAERNGPGSAPEGLDQLFDITWTTEPAVAVPGEPLLVRVQVQNTSLIDVTADTNFYLGTGGLTAVDGGGNWAACTFTPSPPSVTCNDFTFEQEDLFEFFLVLDVPPAFNNDEIEFFYQHSDGDTLDSNHAVNVLPTADLRMTKIVQPLDTVYAGEQFTYTLIADNLGPSRARNIVITDTLVTSGFVNPNGCSIAVRTAGGVVDEFNCNFAASTGVFDLGTFGSNWLNPRSPTDMGRIVITINATAERTGTATDVATITSDTFDPDTSNNIATADIRIVEEADLRLSKLVQPMGTVQAGDTFTYTVFVDNLGPSPARNVVITDTLLSSGAVSIQSCAFSVSQGGGTITQFTCTTGGLVSTQFGTDIGTFSTNVLDPLSPNSQGRLRAAFRLVALEAITVQNTTRVTSNTPDPDMSNNFADSAISVAATSDLAISKSDSPDPVVAGNQLTYTVNVTNNGRSTANGVVVRDVLPAEVDVVSVTPSTGACVVGTPGLASDPTTCNLGNISSGGSRTITIVVNVKPSAVSDPVTDQAIIHNDALVTSNNFDPNTGNNLASEDTTVLAQADLELLKFAVGSPLAGELMHYEYQIANLGPSVSRDVTLRDFLPTEVDFVSAFVDVEGGQGGVPLACDITVGSNALFCPLGDIAPTDGVPIFVFVNVRIRPDVPGGTVITNNADVFLTDTPDPDPSNNSDDASVVVQSQADLAIEKTVEPQKVNAGEQVKYTIRVENNGPSAAANVFVTDTLPAGVTYEVDTDNCTVTGTSPAGGQELTCTDGTLSPGEVWEFHVWVVVDAAAGPGGTLTNEACVFGETTLGDPNPDNDCDTADIFIEQEADLRITKFVSPHNPVRAGEQFTYTIIVDNLGPSRADNVVITDTLVTQGFVDPNGCSIAVRTDGGLVDEFDCNFALSTGVFDLGTFGANWLNPRSPTDMGRVIITINATADEPTDLSNMATVTSDAFDPNLDNNVAIVTHSVAAVSDLNVTKSAVGEVTMASCPPTTGLVADQVTAGQVMTYTITVENAGPSTAENVTVLDRLPPGITVTSVTPSKGSCSTGTPGSALDRFTCGIGTLNAGASQTVTVVATVDQGLPDGTVLENDVFVESDMFDPANVDNYANNLTTVNTWADLSVTKADDPDPVVAGELIEYTITVRNDGPSLAREVVVTDTLDAGVEFRGFRDPFSHGISCSLDPIDERTVTCALPDMPSGDVVVFTIFGFVQPDAASPLNNQVEVASQETPDPCLANNTFNEDTVVDREDQLFVFKDDDPDPVLAGNEITYTITFGNNGPSTATGVRLTDTLPLGFTFDRCESLDINDQVNCSLLGGDGDTTNQVVLLEQIFDDNVLVYQDGGTVDPGDSFTFRLIADVDPGYVLDGRGDTGPGEACERFFQATGYPHYAHNRVDFDSNEDHARDDECTRVNSAADLELVVSSEDCCNVGAGVFAAAGDTGTARQVGVMVAGPDASGAGPAGPVTDGVVPVASTNVAGDASENRVDPAQPGGTQTGLLGRLRSAAGTVLSRARVVASGAANRWQGRTSAATDAASNPEPNAAAPALPLQAAAAECTISPGEEVQWTLTVTNNGPSDAADVLITAQLPPGVVHDPAVVEVIVAGDTVDDPFIDVRDDGFIQVQLCRLNAGGVVTIDIRTRVRQDAEGTQTLEAMVQTVIDDRCPDRTGRPTMDPQLSNNSGSADVNVVTSAITVEKTVSFNGQCPGRSGRVTAQAGQPVTYCLEITNTGDTFLDQIQVTDTLESRFGSRVTFTDVITSGADPFVPVQPGETVTRSYTIPSLLGGECGLAVNTVEVSATPTNQGRTVFECVLPATATDSVRVEVPCAGVDFRLQLPVIQNGECDAWIQVQNVGEKDTKALLVIWGEAGFCPPQAAGPLKVECSGLLRPGSAWSFAASQLPQGAVSAMAYSMNATNKIPSRFGTDLPFADVVCDTLFFSMVGDYHAYAAFDEAYRTGQTFLGLDFGANKGQPLAVTVNRQCPDPTDPNVVVNAAYTGISTDQEGARDPLFGGFTYYAPLVLADLGGLDSWIWIQNSGIECTSLEVWFKAQDNCLRPILGDVLALAPGESIHFDPNSVVGPDWQGSAWIRASQPLGVVVDTMGANHFTSHKGVPGDVHSLEFSTGTQVNYAPLIYNQQQGWDSAIQVQNLSSTTAAKVKVYFLDRSGGIVNTLVDWICPRGSQTFFLPVIGGLPGNWVGSARIESQEWWSPGDPVVDPPRVQSVVLLEKWDDPARTMRREAVAYNAFTERTLLDWQIGRGDGTDGSAVLAFPLLAKENRGITTELALTNLVSKPGFTDFVIYLYDQNGLIDHVCQKLNEKQVEYIDLSQWGFIAPRWLGSAVVSATFWEHEVFDPSGGFVRNMVGLGGVAVERVGTTQAGGDIPGDESKAYEAFPVFDFFLDEPFVTCPGLTGAPRP